MTVSAARSLRRANPDDHRGSDVEHRRGDDPGEAAWTPRQESDGNRAVAAPAAARTLTIPDDEALPVVTLALDPASIGENGSVSTVTERPSTGRRASASR